MSYNPCVLRRPLWDLRNLSEISDWSKVPNEIAETSPRYLRNVLDISEHCLRSQNDPLRYQKPPWCTRIIPEISDGSSEIAVIRPKWDRKKYPEISEPIRSQNAPQSSQNPPYDLWRSHQNLRNIPEISKPSLISKDLTNLSDISQSFMKSQKPPWYIRTIPDILEGCSWISGISLSSKIPHWDLRMPLWNLIIIPEISDVPPKSKNNSMRSQKANLRARKTPWDLRTLLPEISDDLSKIW